MSSKQTVFHLFYEREYDYRDETELSIGYFATEAEAQKVQDLLVEKPGFKDQPEGFVIDKLVLGHFGFSDGFETVAARRSQRRDREFFDLPL